MATTNATGAGGNSTTVDAHHHLWDPRRRDYPWMTGPAAALRRPYGLAELAEVTETVGVGRTVLVQAVHDEGETADLLELAAASGGRVAGVVGWVDLTAADLADRLAALRARPGGDRLVGIRHQVHDEPDPDWLTRPEVLRGLRVLATAGLAYDLLVRPRELPAAVAAAKAVDGLRFVLDHGGKPPIAANAAAAETWQRWRAGVAELAALPHVSCKLSGLVTEADWVGWTVADLLPYAEHLLDWYTSERLMFGSDWPVCTLAASYGEVYHTARELVAGASAAEADAIFADTAHRVYQLP